MTVIEDHYTELIYRQVVRYLENSIFIFESAEAIEKWETENKAKVKRNIRQLVQSVSESIYETTYKGD